MGTGNLVRAKKEDAQREKLRQMGVDLPEDYYKVITDNIEPKKAGAGHNRPMNESALETIPGLLAERGLTIPLDRRFLEPMAQAAVMQKYLDGTLDQDFLNRLAEDKTLSYDAEPSTFNRITKIGMQVVGGGFLGSGLTAAGKALAAAATGAAAAADEGTSGDSTENSSSGSSSSSSGSDINFDAPNFDPLSGEEVFSQYDPGYMLDGSGGGFGGLLDNLTDAGKQIWDTIPDPIKNTVSNLFGGLFEGGIPGLLNSYRGKEAAQAMQEGIDNAKQNQEKYYGISQDYLSRGLERGRDDLWSAEQRGNKFLTDAENIGRNDLFAGQQQGNQALEGYYNTGRNDITTGLNQSRQDVAPWYQGGQSALNQQMGLMGLSQLPGGQTPQSILENTPGYQWQMGQGVRAVQNQMARRGLSASGAEQKGIMNYAQGLASTSFNDRLNQLSQLSGLGATMGQQMGQNQMNAGTNLSNLAERTGANMNQNYMSTGQNMSTLSQQTGQAQSQNTMNSGINLSELAANTGTNQSANAMQTGANMGAYDLAGAKTRADVISGVPGQSNNFVDLWTLAQMR